MNGSANQPLEQETGQVAAGIEDRHDMDPISIVSIDDPPWSFNQFPIDEDVHRPEFGNDPTMIGQHGERPASALHSRESCEGILRVSSAMSSTMRSRSSLAASVQRTWTSAISRWRQPRPEVRKHPILGGCPLCRDIGLALHHELQHEQRLLETLVCLS